MIYLTTVNLDTTTTYPDDELEPAFAAFKAAMEESTYVCIEWDKD